MNKFIRFYNQNRYMVWVVALSIAAFIALIQIFDDFAYEKNKANENINNSNKNTINYNYSVITGQEVNSEVSKIIDEFIEYCNNGQVENAYEMLSEECKIILYPSVEEFTEKYYNRIFKENKSYIYQAWISQSRMYTYRIDFTEDMLATGSPSKTSIIDYYTIVKKDNKYKLNINKFVGIENINKETTKDNVSINIKRKKIYMDYEVYDIEVKNNTRDIIMLDDMQSTDNIYVEDNNEEKYFWYNHEYLENDVTVRAGFTQSLSIKFNKRYNKTNKTARMIFKNVLLSDGITKINIEI